MLASQRRLERKLKELNMMLDEERQTHAEQRDQVHTFIMFYLSVFVFTLRQETKSNTLSCVAADFESKSSQETSG